MDSDLFAQYWPVRPRSYLVAGRSSPSVRWTRSELRCYSVCRTLRSRHRRLDHDREHESGSARPYSDSSCQRESPGGRQLGSLGGWLGGTLRSSDGSLERNRDGRTAQKPLTSVPPTYSQHQRASEFRVCLYHREMLAKFIASNFEIRIKSVFLEDTSPNGRCPSCHQR